MLIAEIGNNHFGDFKVAKELVKAAIDSGADLVKGQAFIASDLYSGSMEEGFYDACEFRLEQLIELIEYARELGKDMFFSVFSKRYQEIVGFQEWHKISASQSQNFTAYSDETLKGFNYPNVFISLSAETDPPVFTKATLLHATKYLCDDPEFYRLKSLRLKTNNRPIGLSDHSLGIDNCLLAIKEHGVSTIEKHFTLKKNLRWNGTVFRDTVHGATPKEFNLIAKELLNVS